LLALALFSFAPLFIFISAWSSNNKYSLIGGMRSAAQMIAYEVPILLAVVAVVVISGSFDLTTIVTEQQNYWYWGPLFLALIVFVAGMLAEMERIPFDLPEAEAELVEGWNTEYGGMLFAFFMLADYVRALVGSILVVLLFLGGWTLPSYVPAVATSFPLAGILWFMVKTYLVFGLFVWVRASLPRVRTDQLLRVGWMRMIPLSLLSIVLAGLVVLARCLPVFGCVPGVGG
jgi:NADH-quinone oxidoreductase subunit H